MTIRWLASDERPTLTRFIAERNVPGRQLCLHLADRPDDVAADLAELEPLTACCLVWTDVGRPDAWRGVVAWEVGGPAGDRAWLFGPWAAADDVDAAVRLLEAALIRLPATVTRVDNYVDLGFVNGLEAHRALGFDARRTVHIMRAESHLAVDPPAAVTIAVVEADPEARSALVALHDRAFPDTHTDVDGMLAAADGRLWCARGEGVVGYVYAARTDEPPGGTVEYVAVDPAHRGSGIGRALLSAAVEWLLAEGAGQVFLTVDADNERALGVYRAAGFAHYRSGRALTLRRVIASA